MNRSLSIMSRVGTDAAFFDDPEEKDIRQLLDKTYERDKTEGMKRIMALMSYGKDVSDFFPHVIKNIVAQSLELKKLVYIYLAHYAERRPDEALMAINTLQRDLSDPNALVRAMALRAMSGIRVHAATPLVLLAIKKCARDPSCYVRTCTAHAIPKVYSKEHTEFNDTLEEILGVLMRDSGVGVMSAAVSAFGIVCRDKVMGLGPHFGSLCRILPDLDEWGQPALIDLLMRYSIGRWGPAKGRVVEEDGSVTVRRDSSVSPSTRSSGGFVCRNGSGKASGRGSWGSERFVKNRSQGRRQEGDWQRRQHPPSPVSAEPSDEKKSPGVYGHVDDRERVPEGLKLLLKCTRPLLLSNNSCVVMGAALAHYYLAPSWEVQRIIDPLLFVLRSSPESQSVILANIATIAHEMPELFERHHRDFFIRSTDPFCIRAAKLQILRKIATENNIEDILHEFETYIWDSDREFVAETIRAVAHCALQLPSIAPSCVSGLLALERKVLPKPLFKDDKCTDQAGKAGEGKGKANLKTAARASDQIIDVCPAMSSETTNSAKLPGEVVGVSSNVGVPGAASSDCSSRIASANGPSPSPPLDVVGDTCDGTLHGQASRGVMKKKPVIGFPAMEKLQDISCRGLGTRGSERVAMFEEKDEHSESKDDAVVVTEAILAIQKIAATDPRLYETTLVRLVRSLDIITEPKARALVVGMMGRYVGLGERITKAVYIGMRFMAGKFADEDAVTKLQILNSSMKVFLQSRDCEDAIDACANAKLLSHVTDLARCDPDYDIRDRARLIRQMVLSRSEMKALSQRAKLAFARARQAARIAKDLQKGSPQGSSSITTLGVAGGEVAVGASAAGLAPETAECVKGVRDATEMLVAELGGRSSAEMEGEGTEMEEAAAVAVGDRDAQEEDKEGEDTRDSEEGSAKVGSQSPDQLAVRQVRKLAEAKLVKRMERVLNPRIALVAPLSSPRKQTKFLLGTMSHIVSHKAQGYDPLPSPKAVPPEMEAGLGWDDEERGMDDPLEEEEEEEYQEDPTMDHDFGDGIGNAERMESGFVQSGIEDREGEDVRSPGGKFDAGRSNHDDQPLVAGARGTRSRISSLLSRRSGERSRQELEAWLGAVEEKRDASKTSGIEDGNEEEEQESIDNDEESRDSEGDVEYKEEEEEEEAEEEEEEEAEE